MKYTNECLGLFLIVIKQTEHVNKVLFNNEEVLKLWKILHLEVNDASQLLYMFILNIIIALLNIVFLYN